MFTIEIEDGREAPLKPGIDIFLTKFCVKAKILNLELDMMIT